MRSTLAMFIAVILGADVSSAEELKIGVLAVRGPLQCTQKWGETGWYLTRKLCRTVSIVPLSHNEIDEAVVGKRIDFLLPNPSIFVEQEKKFGLVAISTMMTLVNNKPISSFGGVIFVKADSPINSLTDIKGRKYAVVEFSGFGGGQMQARELLKAGIDPTKDCTEYKELKKQDNVVQAVKNGLMDVGAIRTDMLETMEREGRIKMSEFKIINEIKDDFPFVRSTRLYPEWPMARLAHIDAETGNALANALRALAPEDEACKKANIYGWVEPADYTPVRECLKEIRFGSFAGQ